MPRLSLNFISDLTLGQKLQLGFLVVMFAIAGILAWRAMRPTRDMTVTSWVENRQFGADPAKPISAANPLDPQRSCVVTIFACHDGHLEISELPEDPEAKPAFRFIPDTFIKSYDFYGIDKTPTVHLRSISDPTRYAVALAAYNMTHFKSQNLGPSFIARAGLTIEQSKTERQLQRTMLQKIEQVQQEAKSGFYKTDLRDRAMTALMTYRTKDGDPTRDPSKAAVAWNVIDASMNFINAEFIEESQAIETYINGMMSLLTRDQKAKLAEAGKLAQEKANGRSGVASLKLAAAKPELDPTTGMPNVAYVRNALHKSITILTDAIRGNDDKQAVAAVTAVLTILNDTDLCTRYKPVFQSNIDGWLKDLIALKRNDLVEHLASAAIETFAGDDAFVAVCQDRRKLDPGKPGMVFATTQGGAATMRAVAPGGAGAIPGMRAGPATRPAAHTQHK
ncbi:MAG: hypothetical protein FWD61_08260 [Phycisphaerales bacterium]|nr:hypothetical protein [Phycisphaerales bacterium]